MRIGIIEDNDVILEMLKTAFSMHGHEVVLYKTGFAFLLSHQAEQPLDILLVDLLLPGGLTGVETLQSFYQITPESTLPIIVVSGAGDPMLQSLRQNFPDIAVVIKPPSLRKLIQMVEQVSSSA